MTVKASKQRWTVPLPRTDVLRATKISKKAEYQWRIMPKVVAQQIFAKLRQTPTPVRKEPVSWIAALEIFAMLPQYHLSAPSSLAYALFWPLLSVSHDQSTQVLQSIAPSFGKRIIKTDSSSGLVSNWAFSWKNDCKPLSICFYLIEGNFAFRFWSLKKRAISLLCFYESLQTFVGKISIL